MNEILNILGSVGFNWHVALANFINFLIILILLNKFFFRKIGKTIEKRHEIIERGLSDASDAEKALANAEEEKHKIVTDARKEGHSIVEEAKGNAEVLASGIKKDAENDAATKLAEISKKEANLKDSVEKEFALRAPELVAKMYAETLSKELTASDNDALISRIKA